MAAKIYLPRGLGPTLVASRKLWKPPHNLLNKNFKFKPPGGIWENNF